MNQKKNKLKKINQICTEMSDTIMEIENFSAATSGCFKQNWNYTRKSFGKQSHCDILITHIKLRIK